VATVSAARATHKTLTANTVDIVTLTADRVELLEVANRNAAGEIYFTVGSAANVPADPTVGGDDTYMIPAGMAVRNLPVPDQQTDLVVKLISSAATAYSVRVN
jgi:hypothetical protein